MSTLPDPEHWAPEPRRRRRAVLGIAVPVLVVLAVAGYLLAPRVRTIAAPGAPTAAGPTASAPEPPPVPTDNVAMPAAHTCYAYAMVAGFGQINGRAESGAVVPCDQDHELETIAVGPIDDATEPEPASPAAHELYARCDAAATEFLGVPYRSTLTILTLALPGPVAWQAGAHWYRCDLAAIGTLSSPIPKARRGSLQGNAEPITCLTWNVPDDAASIDGIESIDCDKIHNGELAGVVSIPADIDRTAHDAVQKAASDLCAAKARDFLGGSGIRPELSVWMWPLTRDPARLDWNVLCMATTHDLSKRLTASIKNVGSGPLPIA